MYIEVLLLLLLITSITMFNDILIYYHYNHQTSHQLIPPPEVPPQIFHIRQARQTHVHRGLRLGRGVLPDSHIVHGRCHGGLGHRVTLDTVTVEPREK